MYRQPLLYFVLFLLCSFSASAKKEPLPERINKPSTSGFRENKGQLHDQHGQPRTDILFQGVSSRMSYYLKKNGVSYQLYKSNGPGDPNAETITIQRIDIEWLGTNKDAKIITGAPMPDVENYYNTETPVLNARSFSNVVYKNIYAGIDLKFYQQNGNLKYDYIVHPGADYTQIRLKVNGAELVPDKSGSLSLETPLGIIKEGTPKVYQGNKIIASGWAQNGNELSFKIGAYDKTQPLIIDPLVVALYTGTTNSAPTGSFTTTYALDVSVDNSGNLFYCGRADWGFVRKNNSVGAQQFSQQYPLVIPVSNGPTVYTCANNNDGDVYVAGTTSTMLAQIVTSGAYQTTVGSTNDAFIVKINPTGTRLWGTYYGGSGDESILNCSVDQNGNLYVVGHTASTNVMSSAGAHQVLYGGGAKDGFIAKFDTAGTRIWGTYYGGAAEDELSGCSIDNNSNLIVCGTTKSGSDIATPGAYQTTFSGTANGLLIQFDTNGVRQWGTYYGADSTTIAKCETNASGDIIVCGTTTAATGIATSGVFQPGLSSIRDGYAVKFSSTGSRIWGTYMGGSVASAVGCGVATDGKIYIAGNTSPSSNIATVGADQTTLNTGTGGYLEELDNTGQRLWGTYYSSTTSAYPIVIHNCYVDDSNYVYLSGGVRTTTSGLGSATLRRYKRYTTPTPVITANPATSFCANTNVQLGITPITTATYQWYLDGAPISGATTASYTTNTAGGYIVTINHNSSSATSSSTTLTSLPVPTTSVTETDILCNGAASGAISISASGGTAPYTYSWTNNASTSSSISGLAPNTYIATTKDANNCIKKDTIYITQPTAVTFTKSRTHVLCNGDNNGAAGVTVAGGVTPYSYSWNTTATTSSISSLTAGTYTIQVIDGNSCVKTDTIVVTQPAALAATHIHNDVDCYGGSDGVAEVSVIGGTAPYTYTWSNSATASFINGLTAGTYTVVTTDNHSCIRNDTFTITQPSDIIRTLTTADNHCFGDSAGKAFVLAAGGVPPYTYQWSDGTNILSTVDSAVSLWAGNYTLQIVDANGCLKTDPFTINEPPQALVSICAITVDSTTGKNLVIWEKSGIVNDMQYRVYRETFISGTYNLIGAKWSSEMSTLEDTSSVPLQQSYSYRVSVVDSCNNESPWSAFHKTIHLISNVGINNEVNLIWNEYEGKSYGTHYIMRSSNGGPFVNIAQVASTITSYSDLTPPAGQKDYRIDIDLGTSCNPTAKSTSYDYVSSNTVTIDPVNVPAAPGRSIITLYPNPSSDMVFIKGTTPASIQVEDVTGKVVLREVKGNSVSLQSLANGAYIIKLMDDKGNRYYQHKVIKK